MGASMTPRVHFAQLLTAYRDGRPATYVAEKVGCDARTILNLEAAKSVPRLPVYVRLCRLYGLSLAQRAELDNIAAAMGEVEDA